MANEQTSVPLYAASEVLTAANMNISAGTGVPVFATTVTRDAAFGGANEKVLAEGQLCYLSATNVVQYYDGAAWATVGPSTAGALTLISTTTIGSAVSSVALTSLFSATYENYLIKVSGGAGSTTDNCNFILGATTAGYYNSIIFNSVGTPTPPNGTSVNNGASTGTCMAFSTNGLNLELNIYLPFAAKRTAWNFRATIIDTVMTQWSGGGFVNNATSYTGMTFTTSSGTLTGGEIRVYGYQNS